MTRNSVSAQNNSLKRETGIYFNGAIKHWHEKPLNEDRDMKQTPTDSGSERRQTFPVCSQREMSVRCFSLIGDIKEEPSINQ